MGRRAFVFAALVAVGLLPAVPAAAAGPTARRRRRRAPRLRDACRVAAQYVERRWRAASASSCRRPVPLSAASVTLNGVDVTSSFAPDDRAPHALEGVLTDLPLGSSTVAATVPGPGRSANDRASLKLSNHPATGPMFSGPQQPDFFCSTPGNLAGFDLTGPFLDEDCSLPTRVGHYYRAANGTWKPYDAAAPRARRGHDADDDERRRHRRLRHPVGARDAQPLHLLDRGARPDRGAGPRSLPYWNRKLIFYFGGGVAIGHYQGSNNQNESRYPYGLGQGYAIAWSTGTKTNTHYNLQLGGETALMVKERFVSAYADPEYTVGVGGSGGAIQQYVYGQNHPGLLDAACRSTRTRTWSRRRSMSATASCSSAGWTRRSSPTRSRCGGRGSTGRVEGLTPPRRSRTRTSRDAVHGDAGLDASASTAGAASRRSRSTRLRHRAGYDPPSTGRSSGRTGATS